MNTSLRQRLLISLANKAVNLFVSSRLIGEIKTLVMLLMDRDMPGPEKKLQVSTSLNEMGGEVAKLAGELSSFALSMVIDIIVAGLKSRA